MRRLSHSTVFLSYLVCSFYFVVACGGPDVSVVIKSPKKGKIKIDGRMFEDYVKSKHGTANNDTLFFLQLENGNHTFEILMAGKR